jgi:serine/threonine protein kinase
MNHEIKGSPKSYRVLETLHESQHSHVLRVVLKDEDLKIYEIVVLKILHSQNSFQECVQELESLKKVKVSRCVEVLNWEKFDNRPALVLENIKGMTLKELVKRVHLDDNTRNYILSEIHEGLVELSRAGIYHGDLSPNNVMMDTLGKIKLIDYGMANLSGKYTPNFVSPETLSGSVYNYSSDLYSLGKLAFYLGACKSIYLSMIEPIPENRRFQKLNYNKDKAILKLSNLIQHQYIEKNVPATIFQDLPLTSKKYYWLTILTFLFLSGSAAYSNKYSNGKSVSHLTLITKEWVHIEVDSIDLGYTPIYLREISIGTHKIKWRSAHATGELVLNFQPNEHKKIVSNQWNNLIKTVPKHK